MNFLVVLVLACVAIAGCSGDRWMAAGAALQNATLDDPGTLAARDVVVNATAVGINATADFLHQSFHGVTS